MSEENKRRVKILIRFFIIVLVLTVFCVWQNNDIVVTEYDYTNTKIPEEFSGFKILHLSDLHNKEFGKDQRRLLKHTKKINPDIIVITGDLIDSHTPNLHVIESYIKEATQIAPIYFVSGNHEEWSNQYESLVEILTSYNVHILDHEKLIIENKGSSINIIGLQDMAFYNSDLSIIDENLKQLISNNENSFNLLLSHRPELMDYYVENDVDLVLSGHAHGGQIHIPFVGGLMAPNQNFPPKYVEGMHEVNHTTMIISRGLGNSILPIRIFNRPELVVITLKNEHE